MSENTAISWCDATFNPWWGCQKVSPACDHCYAERDAKRFAPGRVLWGVGSERRTFEDKHWQAPLRWAAKPFYQCGMCGLRGEGVAVGTNGHGRACKKCDSEDMREVRRRVFCASMADWLDLDAPIDEFVRLLDTIRSTPELDWLLLSKRIGNWRKRMTEAQARVIDTEGSDSALAHWIERWLAGEGPMNVWLGATVVNQQEADRDVPKLLAVPARVRFLSIEPMLGPIDLTWIDDGHAHREVPREEWGEVDNDESPPGLWWNVLTGKRTIMHGGVDGEWSRTDASVDWVIAGGESGPHARPAHPEWFRSLRDQCAAAGVQFHFKQWGEHTAGELSPHPTYSNERAAWRLDQRGERWHDPVEGLKPREEWATVKFLRVGKAAAGRLLDGVEHNGFPS